MALNDKGGFDLGSRLKREQKAKSTDTDTYTDTHTYAPAHFPTTGSEERKTARLQLTIKPSTKSKLAKYAADHNTSVNEVTQRILEGFLNDSGY